MSNEEEFMRYVVGALKGVAHKAIIAYGYPNKGDIDILVVSRSKERINEMFKEDALYDIMVKDHNEFKEALKMHGHKGVEFRVYKGMGYVQRMLKETGMGHIKVRDYRKP